MDRLQLPNHLASQAGGLLRLTLRGEFPPGIAPGDRLAVRATLFHPRPAGTPGVFDYRQHLAGQGIWVTGRIRAPANIQKILALTPAPLSARWAQAPERLRHRLIAFIRARLPIATASLYNAILFGDLSGISEEVLENYKAAGCLHLLAISGLNIAILALVVMTILSWLLTRSTWIILHLPHRKIAVAVTILPLIAYSCLAGLHFPVLRALLMAAAFMTALILDRQWSIIHNLALAAWAILVWEPTALFTVSFQLTFAAVLAIAVIMPRLRPLLDLPGPAPAQKDRHHFLLRLRGQILAGLAMAAAATIGTLPLLLFYFNRFSPYSAIATLLVEPLLCFWAMVTGLVACLFVPFAPLFAGQLLTIGGWGITLAGKLTAFFAALPASSIWLPTPTPLEVASAYLLISGLFTPRRTPLRLGLLLAGSALGLTALFLQFGSARPDKIALLDLGQGSGSLLQLSSGHTILVDGGGNESPRFNPGERIIAPYLWHERLTRLDQVIVTHPHADHYNGLPFILERFRPRTLWINGQAGDRPYQELLAQAIRLGIAVKTPSPGTVLFQEGANRLLCLDAPAAPAPVNNQSLVLRFASGPVAMLFPGDLDQAAEQRLVARFDGQLKSPILLASHHGSAGSSSREFLQAVAPRYIAISAGPSRTLELPDRERLASYRQLGAEVRQTARGGTIFFSWKGEELRVRNYLGETEEGAAAR